MQQDQKDNTVGAITEKKDLNIGRGNGTAMFLSVTDVRTAKSNNSLNAGMLQLHTPS